MSVHQVITGALNKGENVYAIGGVEGITFTVCAVGSDVVILGSDFIRMQIIPGCSHHTEQLVTSVSCCGDSGKIAGTYGDMIRVFEPISTSHDRKSDPEKSFPFKWVETQCFTVKGFVNTVLWNMDGLRMLIVVKNELILYQHRSVSGLVSRPVSANVMFCISEDEQSKTNCSWDAVWSCHLPTTPKYIKFSPDGGFFAVAGENDSIVKIFYQEHGEFESKDQPSFEFISLQHPAAVKGLEWRRTGRYMPRKCIQSVLMTWCEDNTSRIWKETPPPELAIIDLSGDGGEPAWEHNKPKKFLGKHMKVKSARKKILNRLKGLVPEKKKKHEEKEHGMGLRAQIGHSPSLTDLHAASQPFQNVQFHLAASINAETDCLLVPSLDSYAVERKSFCVHWLNNKELVFSLGAERLLAETLMTEGEGMRYASNGSTKESTPADAQEAEETNPIGEKVERPLSAFGGSVCSETPSNKDLIDVKLEILLRQWTKSNDILFTVHPVDGSLLVWTVEWLDDLHRQPTVSLNSRFPGAFPITDASSLQPTLNTFNPHEPLYVDVLRQDHDHKEQETERVFDKDAMLSPTNTIHMLTNHENGTLNLWHIAMEEGSNFQTILNVSHISRMCGHRFQIKQVVAHPVLPLLLTTSQFRSTDAKDTSHYAALSEVILWKILPVGPLCRSGGVIELARVADPSRIAFSSLSWIPTILPSCTLGTICNSPSACFISSNGTDLVIYQAVVDARGLLNEIHEANRISQVDDDAASRRSLTPTPRPPPSSLLQQLKVVSTQSTAKPGCVLEIGSIPDVLMPDEQTLLIHIFNERLIFEDDDATNEDSQSRMGVVVDRSDTNTFKDRFFVVIVQRGEEADTFLMYSLVISSQQPQPIPHYDVEDLPDEKGFLRPASPLAHSVAKLHFQSELVCKQTIDLPSGSRIVSAAPVAGHLPSSTIYPACQAPFLLLTSGTDDVVRCWKCSPDSTRSNKYVWKEWNTVGDGHASDLEVEGTIYSVSAAHSGRIACAYDPRSGSTLANASEVEIGVFECESSGGVEWMREDTLHVRDVYIPSAGRSPAYPSSPYGGSTQDISTASRILNGPSEDLIKAMNRPETISIHTGALNLADKIRIDWVSTEDGGHILTVGVAAKVYLYTQVSQDPAQQNVVLMKESETTMRRPSLRKMSSLISHHHPNSTLTKWICTRILALESADGLPPIPTTLSWARDGILVVGMPSEMRVYNQWNLKPNTEAKEKHEVLMTKRGSTATPTVTISASYSMLDQLNKKKELPVSKSRMRMDLTKTHPPNKEQTPHAVLEAISGEGLFEAARLSSPILPQYHPKQLIVLLNAGRTKRVKAILLHVLNALKQHQGSIHNPLSRAASVRRMSTVDGDDANYRGSVDGNKINLEEDSPDYNEIDDISPLPLYALIAADQALVVKPGENAEDFEGNLGYDSLFTENNLNDDDLDEMLKDTESGGGRSRHHSGTSLEIKHDTHMVVAFTAKHNRLLTELLTHTHLPGLSSVDQMHLLAIADTLSHFSSDVMDKLTQANAALKPVVQSVLGESSAGGYATAAAGVETVDECGLRFLMAMKQHEYLLLCLPPKQRMDLKQQGLSSSNIIWAQHSETETELLNAVPFMQKSNPTWEDIRSLGIAWWLKNTGSLTTCIEKLARAAFQKNQDPMDAALFYLAMKKKNVLTQLFKTARNQQMADFFSNDFTQDYWKRTAAKNAFVLMGKQRFQHAAAFFLLHGSLKDAVQTVLRNCNDLQLALVIVRLYEKDMEQQQNVLKEILCREVLGMSGEEFDTSKGKIDENITLYPDANKDPFIRSMALWCLKDYARAAHTLVEEAHQDRLSPNTSLSDIFNFYSFLRKHPLVVRQRLTDAGAQVGSTEKFIAVGKHLESLVTPAERRLFFRTAAEHMARGCPMLALEVLSRLPKNLLTVKDTEDLMKMLIAGTSTTNNKPTAPPPKSEDVDWSQPTNVVKEDELDLGWSEDDEDEELEEKTEKKPESPVPDDPYRMEDPSADDQSPRSLDISKGATDVIAQHLKFVASLRILTEELSTLASGFEVDGGQLRYQLFIWLEKEVDVLKTLCDYRNTEIEDFEEDLDISDPSGNTQQLHEALKHDHAEMVARLKITSRRRKWLTANQKLLRSFTSYCALHSGQNHRLTSALMELLLLLLEIQKDSGIQHLSEAVPEVNTFPLLEASISSTKMFVSSPLSFIENQCHDLLLSIAHLTTVPSTEHNLQKTYMLYNLCQGLSSCLYQSLCDVDQFNIPAFLTSERRAGALTCRPRYASSCEDIRITTAPNKWPGLDNLVALMGREKDDDRPPLRHLLAECYVSIVMSLFCFAIAAHDARWLYRLSSHDMNENRFGWIFGGGGHKKLKTAPPSRPPRPLAPRSENATENPSHDAPGSDAHAIRSKLHSKLLGHATVNAQVTGDRSTEQIVLRWVPPHKNIVQMFAEKPPIDSNETLGVEFDSDDEHDDASVDSFDEEERCENANLSSYAWTLMRLALIEQQIYKVKQFLTLAGFDITDIPSSAPRLDAVLRLLYSWSSQLRQELAKYPGGCPVDLIPNTTLDSSDGVMTPTAKKYSSLLEKGNTPFESDDPRVLPIKRLWAFLVRENHLQNIFISYIYAGQGQQETPVARNDTLAGNLENQSIPEAFKIIQKDNEPIVAFACNQEKPGLLVVSNGRELQEMDISNIFDEKDNPSSWLYNRTSLDVQLLNMKKDTMRDNDDYQLFTDTPNASGKQAQMLFKRTVAGIRRIDSHPTAPFYVTGSTDGSIRVWEWGVGQPVYTARVAGQYAKVSKITFSCNGNKFAAVDGDGMLCLWQASLATEQKKPFFSHRCHNKSASDVRFLGHSSSVLLTAGCTTGDYNLGLWDTLLPSNKAMVHSWVAHTEGATCAMYLPNHQTIVSGGRHGDICLWDVRQRQLRSTVKAFEANHAVKSLVTDLSQDLIVAGSSEGDIKIWSADSTPQLMYALNGEHMAKGGFSFRQVGQSSIQGVQQLYIDQQMRLFSCGADATLKFRMLPSVYSLNI